MMDTYNDQGYYTSERHNTYQYVCSQLQRTKIYKATSNRTKGEN